MSSSFESFVNWIAFFWIRHIQKNPAVPFAVEWVRVHLHPFCVCVCLSVCLSMCVVVWPFCSYCIIVFPENILTQRCSTYLHKISWYAYICIRSGWSDWTMKRLDAYQSQRTTTYRTCWLLIYQAKRYYNQTYLRTLTDFHIKLHDYQPFVWSIFRRSCETEH